MGVHVRTNLPPVDDGSRSVWMDYPGFEKELQILQKKVPDCDNNLTKQICNFMLLIRKEKLEKTPGIATLLLIPIQFIVL